MARIMHFSGASRAATSSDLWTIGRYQGATGMVVPATDGGTTVATVPWWIRILPRSVRAAWWG